MGNALWWTSPNLFLRREEAKGYTPSEVIEDAALEDFSGYWESVYIEINGAFVDASDLQDDTFIYIEGTNAALGGDLFGNVVAELTFADAAMTYRYIGNGCSRWRRNRQYPGSENYSCSGL